MFFGKNLTGWFQVLLGSLCMLVPGTLLYGWTVFVMPISQAQGWGTPAIQTAFTVFVISEACLLWLTGTYVDKFGPRYTMLAAGLLVGIGGVINSMADTIWMLYLGELFSGIGSGIVTSIAISQAVKWFPNKRRGFAAGLAVTGFALGALITVLPMVDFIKNNGYQSAFIWFGGTMGLMLVIASLFMRVPNKGEVEEQVASKLPKVCSKEYTWQEMVKTPAFWALFAIFTFICMGGHLVTAHLGPIANHFKVANVDISILFGIMAITGFKLALVIDRVCNVVCRPFFGWLSDHLGREYTMALAFTLEAFGIFALLNYAHDPLLFALLSGAVFFAFGEIYVLIPVMIADLFGTENSGTNYGVIYIAKGLASVWVPIGSWIVLTTGSWDWVFYLAAIADVLAAGLSLWLIKLRKTM